MICRHHHCHLNQHNCKSRMKYTVVLVDTRLKILHFDQLYQFVLSRCQYLNRIRTILQLVVWVAYRQNFTNRAVPDAGRTCHFTATATTTSTTGITTTNTTRPDLHTIANGTTSRSCPIARSSSNHSTAHTRSNTKSCLV